MTEVGDVMGDRKATWQGWRLTELTHRASTSTPRALTGLLLVAALGGCQEDLGSEDWLVVDNRTDSEVFVTDTGATGSSHLGSVGAGSSGFGAGAVDRCDARALVAHAGSPDGPVVARRTAADGEACVKAWVVGPDD